jgi:hypothetical protein
MKAMIPNLAIFCACFTVAKPPTIIIGNLTVQEGGSISFKDGQTTVTGYTTNYGQMSMTGARLVCQGGLKNPGTVNWQTSQLLNQADFNLDGKVNLQDFTTFASVWLW